MKTIKNILSVFVLTMAMTFAPSALASAGADDTYSSVEETIPEPEIKVAGQRVEIEISDDLDHQVMVYALTGQVVKTVKATYGTTVIDLPAGYYIVKVDRVAKRVIVR